MSALRSSSASVLHGGARGSASVTFFASPAPCALADVGASTCMSRTGWGEAEGSRKHRRQPKRGSKMASQDQKTGGAASTCRQARAGSATKRRGNALQAAQSKEQNGGSHKPVLGPVPYPPYPRSYTENLTASTPSYCYNSQCRGAARGVGEFIGAKC
eukprot:356545-Chlamydomonas_euryale.AAC.2